MSVRSVTRDMPADEVNTSEGCRRLIPFPGGGVVEVIVDDIASTSDAVLAELLSHGCLIRDIAAAYGRSSKTIKKWIAETRKRDPAWDPLELARRRDGLITSGEVIDYLRAAHSIETTWGTWHWWIRNAGAPHPVRYVCRRGLWSPPEIDAWVASRPARAPCARDRRSHT